MMTVIYGIAFLLSGGVLLFAILLLLAGNRYSRSERAENFLTD